MANSARNETRISAKSRVVSQHTLTGCSDPRKPAKRTRCEWLRTLSERGQGALWNHPGYLEKVPILSWIHTQIPPTKNPTSRVHMRARESSASSTVIVIVLHVLDIADTNIDRCGLHVTHTPTSTPGQQRIGPGDALRALSTRWLARSIQTTNGRPTGQGVTATDLRAGDSTPDPPHDQRESDEGVSQGGNEAERRSDAQVSFCL